MNPTMQIRQPLAAVVFIVAAVHLRALVSASSDRSWSSSRESLADYEVLSLQQMRSEIECTTAASRDSAMQLAAFNASSGLCTQFRCRLGLSHCRKCRNVNKGAQQVWTASNDCWTTVQHRVSGSVNFNITWSQYQNEFGEGPDGNYWIGLNALHALTSTGSRKVRFLMKTWNDLEHWAEYSSFSVGPVSDNYRLSVSGFSGSAGIGDCFSNGHGMQFSTVDSDHDTNNLVNCAVEYSGAWWFSACHCTHPNGQYKNRSDAIGGAYAQGIIWSAGFTHYYSLMQFEMLVL